MRSKFHQKFSTVSGRRQRVYRKSGGNLSCDSQTVIPWHTDTWRQLLILKSTAFPVFERKMRLDMDTSCFLHPTAEWIQNDRTTEKWKGSFGIRCIHSNRVQQCTKIHKLFFNPMPPHVPYGHRGIHPGCGRSVNDFWGWDAYEAQLRCPDEVDGDIWIWSVVRWMVIYGYGVPGGALNLNSTNYPDHGHQGDPPLSEKNPHGRAGNRTRDLLISRQKHWPLDHEDCQIHECKGTDITTAGPKQPEFENRHLQSNRMLYAFCWIIH
jgi:hypothetical protein